MCSSTLHIPPATSPRSESSRSRLQLTRYYPRKSEGGVLHPVKRSYQAQTQMMARYTRNRANKALGQWRRRSFLQAPLERQSRSTTRYADQTKQGLPEGARLMPELEREGGAAVPDGVRFPSPSADGKSDRRPAYVGAARNCSVSWVRLNHARDILVQPDGGHPHLGKPRIGIVSGMLTVAFTSCYRILSAGRYSCTPILSDACREAPSVHRKGLNSTVR